MSEDETVIARQHGRIGRIVLNRPRALNALDPGMIAAVSQALDKWRTDPAIHAVVIEGAGGRAFCAGGDVRAVREAVLAGRHDEIEQFFAEEYALNLAIARYPKPYVALIDGICMGGGIGLSIHGSVRIASERAVFAMPETGIGLFPDVGATYALPRLRGVAGMWLGLTGARVTGPDAVHLGIATHFVPSEAMAQLPDALAADGMAAVADFAEPPPAASTPMGQIQCFGAESVVAIIGRLQALGTPWAAEALAQLAAGSPAAIHRTFDAIGAGARLTLEDALQAELALTRTATRHPDFAEGVRAMLIDKDRTPRWADAPVTSPGASLVNAGLTT